VGDEDRTVTAHGADDAEAAARLDHAASLLMRMTPRIAYLQRDALGRLDPPIGLTQYGVLWRVSQGITSLAELRRTSTVTFSTLSEAISGLVDLGLVERRRRARDRRSVELSLTDAGDAAVAAADAAMAAIQHQLTLDARAPTAAELDATWRPIARRARSLFAATHHGPIVSPEHPGAAVEPPAGPDATPVAEGSG
jgi:DNA-binding MarR family transcriptional regulator